MVLINVQIFANFMLDALGSPLIYTQRNPEDDEAWTLVEEEWEEEDEEIVQV